jgi:hypothetical protein
MSCIVLLQYRAYGGAARATGDGNYCHRRAQRAARIPMRRPFTALA